eukprot:gene6731-4826_t
MKEKVKIEWDVPPHFLCIHLPDTDRFLSTDVYFFFTAPYFASFVSVHFSLSAMHFKGNRRRNSCKEAAGGEGYLLVPLSLLSHVLLLLSVRQRQVVYNREEKNGQAPQGQPTSSGAVTSGSARLSSSTSAPAVRLPVTEARRAIIHMIRNNPAVIIVGETGSGKTTQIPQYIWDDLVAKLPDRQQGIVGCTQPRRVAAVSIACHVAQQRGVAVGEEVGYAVRFDDKSTEATRIKYLTDGILLREIQTDPTLAKYSCVVLDEAHERTLHGDVLFGLLKDITRKRQSPESPLPPLRIVVMSATLNAEQFSEFWWKAPIGVVHGRTFPVTIYHTVEPQVDYVEAAVSTILSIHESGEDGDILCFLTGQEEIEDAKGILEQRMKLLPAEVPSFLVLPLYAALPYEQQLLVFQPAPLRQRKVILATNIAETSITVEGIKFVVDSGVVKAMFYNSKTGMECLTEVDISRAQATQRTGRAGRMAAGKCYRLYPAAAFESMKETATPEICRSSLLSVVLQMKSLHIVDILSFEFMDKPRRNAVVKAEETLRILRAVSSTGQITKLGMRLTDFPIEPMPAMVLLAAKALGIAREGVVVVAMASTENIFLTSRESKEGADKCKMRFSKAAGDHATLLSIFQTYLREPQKDRKAWCDSFGISHRQMLKAEDIMKQLLFILNEKDDSELIPLIVSSKLAQLMGITTDAPHGGAKRNRDGSLDMASYRHHDPMLHESEPAAQRRLGEFELLRRAMCFGYFLQAAFFNAKLGFYQTLVGHQAVYIHPSSVLFTHRKKPALVLFSSVVRTTKQYMKEVSVIHEDWLMDSAPTFFQPAE